MNLEEEVDLVSRYYPNNSNERATFAPHWPPPVGQPRRHHEPVVHEVAVDAVERSVLRDVHLDECAVVEEEARWDVRHVAASLHLLQEVVQLTPTLVEFQPGPVEKRARTDVLYGLTISNLRFSRRKYKF